MRTMSCFVITARCQAYKSAFAFDPLFLISSPAPGDILPLDVLRSTVAPAKS